MGLRRWENFSLTAKTAVGCQNGSRWFSGGNGETFVRALCPFRSAGGRTVSAGIARAARGGRRRVRRPAAGPAAAGGGASERRPAGRAPFPNGCGGGGGADLRPAWRASAVRPAGGRIAWPGAGRRALVGVGVAFVSRSTMRLPGLRVLVLGQRRRAGVSMSCGAHVHQGRRPVRACPGVPAFGGGGALVACSWACRCAGGARGQGGRSSGAERAAGGLGAWSCGGSGRSGWPGSPGRQVPASPGARGRAHRERAAAGAGGGGSVRLAFGASCTVGVRCDNPVGMSWCALSHLNINRVFGVSRGILYFRDIMAWRLLGVGSNGQQS
jgi:hypothetical protein